MSSSIVPGFPVDIGPAYEGQRIRRPDMYVEFGGPKIAQKFELLRVKKLEEVEDEKVEVIGPDLSELKEGESYPIGIVIEVAGVKLTPELEGVLERRIHDFLNYIDGVMHVGSRADIWIRISKKAYSKGLNTLKLIGLALIKLFKKTFPMIEKAQVKFVTDPEKVKEYLDEAMKVYEERDKRALALRDEDVDTFYGCILCQSFAPGHVCIITPERPSACGAVSWFDARAAAMIDPKGPIFPVPKGKCLDPVKGEYEGVNEKVKEKSLGNVEKVYLYSMFDYPMTSCGCFEAVAFYIPEVDGIGIVHRGFRGKTPIGLTFGQLAEQVGGGKQVSGFLGISILYMKSRKFLIADGGWRRVVWLPSELKEKLKDVIPPDLYDKIATEKDVSTVEELKKWLIEKRHPVAKKLKAAEAAPPAAPPPAPAAPAPAPAPPVAVTVPTAAPVPQVPIRIVLHNARIYIKKVVVVKKST